MIIREIWLQASHVTIQYTLPNGDDATSVLDMADLTKEQARLADALCESFEGSIKQELLT